MNSLLISAVITDLYDSILPANPISFGSDMVFVILPALLRITFRYLVQCHLLSVNMPACAWHIRLIVNDLCDLFWNFDCREPKELRFLTAAD
jgi:hypothetical protein